ncbi:aldehyde dehydrogenase family protein [Mycoplasma sp. Z355B]|uniref:aldehyde dehydrogenase family protein n=1 Tax=unclassified Mycoplasma TaxID=2683645 RepID=UPI003AAE3D54
MDIKQRKNKLKNLKKAIYNNLDDMCLALEKDLGKSKNEANMTEILPIINELNLYIRKINKWARPKSVAAPISLLGTKSIIEYEPYGTVFIISPWNYPLQLAFIPLINAFAAGNKVILKLSEHSKHSNAIIKQIIANVFAEDEVKVVECSIEETNRIIDNETDFLFFTGSQAVGKIMYQKAASKMIPCVLELGGKNPVIITKDADLALTCQELIFSKLMNAGQTCLAPDFILIDATIAESFRKEFTLQLRQLLDNQLNGKGQFAHLINANSISRLNQMLEQDIDYNAHKIYLCQLQKESKLATEEIFGPILPIRIYHDLDELAYELRLLDDSLSAYVFSKDKKIFDTIKMWISSGSIAWNATSQFIYNQNLPFGGIGNSGIGKYHGNIGFITFSHQRSIFIGRNKRIMPTRILNKIIFSRDFHRIIKQSLKFKK